MFNSYELYSNEKNIKLVDMPIMFFCSSSGSVELFF